jgi:hypothetical protein
MHRAVHARTAGRTPGRWDVRPSNPSRVARSFVGPPSRARACMHALWGLRGRGTASHGRIPTARRLVVRPVPCPSVASFGRPPTSFCVVQTTRAYLYIYPLYVIVSKIFFSILNSSAPIHSLYHPLFTLSTIGPTCHFI